MDIVRLPGSAPTPRRVDADRTSRRVFYGAAASLFGITTAVTIVGCSSMASMGGMPMPGGWTMSMTWMRMPAQSWAGAAASFVGMWIVMMKAMMLPSLSPMLWRYRQAVARDALDAPVDARLNGLIVVAGAGYFFVWTIYGATIFVLGVAIAAFEMQWPALSRAVPFGCGAVIVMAGAMQFTAWKAHHLICCREAPGQGRQLPADMRTAWSHGLRLGLHCGYCTAGLTAVLLALGVMDLRVMVVVTLAITAERLAPEPLVVARAIGVLTVVSGLLWLAHAAALV